jgi:hypothetical protein
MLVLFCPISALQKQNTCQVSVHYQNLHLNLSKMVCLHWSFFVRHFSKRIWKFVKYSTWLLFVFIEIMTTFILTLKCLYFCTLHLKSFYLNNDNFSIGIADFEVSVFLYFSYKKDRKLSKFGDVHWNRYRHFQSIKLIKSERTFKTT